MELIVPLFFVLSLAVICRSCYLIERQGDKAEAKNGADKMATANKNRELVKGHYKECIILRGAPDCTCMRISEWHKHCDEATKVEYCGKGSFSLYAGH